MTTLKYLSGRTKHMLCMTTVYATVLHWVNLTTTHCVNAATGDATFSLKGDTYFCSSRCRSGCNFKLVDILSIKNL